MALFKTTGTFGKFGRIGEFETRRGTVYTPTFMPDGTRGVVKSLLPSQVAGTGVQVVLANTYHLHLAPGEQVIRSLGGLHAFGGWQGPILTDSGGFQVFSLSKLRKITEEGVTFKHPISGEMRLITPETSMQIQIALGSDMIVAFDHLTGLDEKSRDKTREAYDRTHRWLIRCVTEFKRLTKDMKAGQRPLLFGVAQGGMDADLRRKSLEIVQSSDVDGIAIGGLSVGETQAEMFTVLQALAPHYDPNRPRFLLGVGTPPDLRFAYEHGIDMADCVLPTRNARHATVWRLRETAHCGRSPATSVLGVPGAHLRSDARIPSQTALVHASGSFEIDEKIHLTNAQFIDNADPIMVGCDCYACAKGFSKAFLRHQFKVGEPLAGSLASMHNLRYLTRICDEYRDTATKI